MKIVAFTAVFALSILTSAAVRADLGEAGWGTYLDAQCEFCDGIFNPKSCQAHVTSCQAGSTEKCEDKLIVVCEDKVVYSGPYVLEVGRKQVKVTGATDAVVSADAVISADTPVIIAKRKDTYPSKVSAALLFGGDKYKGKCKQQLITGP